MQDNKLKGAIYRCPVCGAEITVIAREAGERFEPHCCRVIMQRAEHMAAFYYCEICGAEVASVSRSCGDFNPHCCSRPMIAENPT